MSRRVWIPCTAFAALALAALAFAGTRSLTVRTFSLGVGNVYPVATAQPNGQQVCEGPVVSQKPFQIVGIWGLAPRGLVPPEVRVEDPATGRVLASGRVATVHTVYRWSARLNRTVAGGKPVRVCVVAREDEVELTGFESQHPDIAIDGTRTAQAPNGSEFALVFVSDRGHTFFNSLPLAFSRAQLFHPSWVGSWTFWLFLAALIAAFGLAVVAVGRAAAADETEA